MIRNPALREVPLGKILILFDKNIFTFTCFFFFLKLITIWFSVKFHLSSGIQQKYIVVTCNYVARQMGVTKLMSVVNAKEKCPQLVLVKGEDLTHYREMSYKVTGKHILQKCHYIKHLFIY